MKRRTDGEKKKTKKNAVRSEGVAFGSFADSTLRYELSQTLFDSAFKWKSTIIPTYL